MMHALQCVDVRDRLESYHDGELPLDEQVAIQGHLGECVTCALAAAELADLSHSFRDLADAVHSRNVPDEALGISKTVLERLDVEARFSLWSQARDLFHDMHLVWAGLGATMATLTCVVGSASVLHAANQERPDSLAGVIAYLASSGSNENPQPNYSDIKQPTAIEGAAIEMSEQDAAFALAAVVSREGHVQNVSVVDADRVTVNRDAVVAMLNEASRAKFEPAQERWGNAVAVNIVWLVASTTVKPQRVARPILHSPASVLPLPPLIEPKPAPEAPKAPSKPSSDLIQMAAGG